MNLQSVQDSKTKRLTLRKIVAADSDVVLFLRSDKIINKYIHRPENRQTKNKEDAIKHIKKLQLETENNRSITWGITLHDDPKIIGTICLWNFSENNKTAEVGYDLNPKFQNKGIMSEALQNVLHIGFDALNVEKIEAFTHTENQNSKKLLLKNDFKWMENRKDDDNPNNVIFEINRNHLS